MASLVDQSKHPGIPTQASLTGSQINLTCLAHTNDLHTNQKALTEFQSMPYWCTLTIICDPETTKLCHFQDITIQKLSLNTFVIFCFWVMLPTIRSDLGFEPRPMTTTIQVEHTLWAIVSNTLPLQFFPVSHMIQNGTPSSNQWRRHHQLPATINPKYYIKQLFRC